MVDENTCGESECLKNEESSEKKEDKMEIILRGGCSMVGAPPVFSQDGKYLFCCCGDAVKVYSIASSECLHTLLGHKALVTCVQINPRFPLQILSGSVDGTIILWDYVDGVKIREYKIDSSSVIYLLPSKVSSVTDHSQKKVYAVLRDATYHVAELILPTMTNRDVHVRSIESPISEEISRVALGSNDEYVAFVKKKYLIISSLKTKERIVHSKQAVVGKTFTCIACHPSEQCIATGMTDGKIFLWYYFFSKDKVVQTFHHWHNLPVLSLCYTREGSSLLSGGHECVLVCWQKKMEHKDFLPRLGAPIKHIATSPDNTLYATAHTDNVINVLMRTMSIQQVYQGLTKGHLGLSVENPIPTGMVLDPRTQAVVMNGRPGHLQFYLMHQEKQLYNLDIVCQNYISPESLEKRIVYTEVEHAAFSQSGDWLATVEMRDDGQTTMELRLKFWTFDDESQNYILNTNVDHPHSEPFNMIKFRPPHYEETGPMLVTTSNDGKFKLWSLADDTDIYRTHSCWNCESVGFYRDYPAGAADFSEDGSLLAVAFKMSITLWDPDTNALRTRLDSLHGTEIRHVLFGQAQSSQFLATTTDKSLIVWNVLSCSVCWTVPISVCVLIPNPDTEYMAAFTQDKNLFVFRPSRANPEYTKKNVSKSTVIHAIFLPSEESTSPDQPWFEKKQLYFLNTQQELLSLIPKQEKMEETKRPVVPAQANLPQTPFSMLMAKSRKTGVEEIRQTDVWGKMGEPGADVLNQLLHMPAHVLPPITTLCDEFVSSLLIGKSGKRKKVVKDKEDDDSSDSDSDSEAGEDNTSDSDMEVDTPQTQASSSKTEEKDPKEKILSEKADIKRLSAISAEQFQWMESVFSS